MNCDGLDVQFEHLNHPVLRGLNEVIDILLHVVRVEARLCKTECIADRSNKEMQIDTHAGWAERLLTEAESPSYCGRTLYAADSSGLCNTAQVIALVGQQEACKTGRRSEQ